MTNIAANLEAVRSRINAACRDARRDPGEVTLLAVSKTCPIEAIRQAVDAGQRHFGESYWQEAQSKLTNLSGLELDWHFIGPLQSNKTRVIASNFAWVHGVDRLKLAERLSEQRPPELPPLQVCVQVNISGEASKSGVLPVAAGELCRAVARLPGLRLRGLMAIPEPSQNAELLRSRFAGVRRLQERLNAEGLGLDTLSMGMSDDLELAILEGANIVRVGTAIFGERRHETSQVPHANPSNANPSNASPL